MNIKMIKDRLEKYYLDFINETDSRSFFEGMSQYVDFIKRTKEILPYIEVINAKRKEDYTKLKVADEKAVQKILTVRDMLLKKVEAEGSGELSKLAKHLPEIDKFAMLDDEETLKSSILFLEMSSIINELHGGRFSHLVADFVLPQKADDYFPTVNSYIFSATCNTVDSEKKYLLDRKLTSLWNAWDCMDLVQILWFQGRELLSTSEMRMRNKEDVERLVARVEYNLLFEEKDDIYEGTRNSYEPMFLEREDHKLYARRVHNYLEECLEKDTHAIEITSSSDDKDIKSEHHKITIFISKNRGIYKTPNVKKEGYPIRGKKRPGILHALKNGKCEAKILCKAFSYNNISFLSKEIKNINENFKNNLDLADDLIIRLDTGGYQLNHDCFAIEFVT